VTRALTEAEALVVAAALGRDGTGLSPSVALDRLPRRTRQTVFQRIYSREWVVDRIIPHPGLFDRAWVTIAVVQPYAERVAACLRGWRAEPGLAHLWASEETILGVFFSSGSAEKNRLEQVCRELGSGRAGFVLSIDTRERVIPVYFDFEAAWSRIVRIAGTVRYPRSLPRTVLDYGSTASPALSVRDRERLVEVLGRSSMVRQFGPFQAVSDALSTSLTVRRLIGKGWAEPRSFLDPLTITGAVSGLPERVAFTHGLLLSGATPQSLFRELVERARISPFLFATDGIQAFFAVLSKSGGIGSGGHGENDRTQVSEVLRNHLQNIAAIREPLADLHAIVNHRYERIVIDDPGKGSNSRPV
jgi:hypothetical protein